MKKALNISLFLSFLLTIMVPLTGVMVHKLASVVFLLLCIVHSVVYRKKLGWKRFLLLLLIVVSFATGIFGMILEEYPVVLQLHKAVSIAVVFFLAIHCYVFHRRVLKK